MNINDCFVIEENDKDIFSENVTFAINKGYKVSSTNCIIIQDGSIKPIHIYQAIMVKELTKI